MLQELESLKLFFASGGTLSYEFRRAQLLLLKEGILKFEKEIHEALYTDLKKSPEECWVTETGFVISEINFTLKHLRRWMKRERVSTNLLNLTSSSFIYKEPLGVVFIIAPWNYPFQLLLTPLVGALAAGNSAVIKPSELAPATAAILQKIIEATFSKNYVWCVQGDGAEVVPQLMDPFRFDHVFYTGSTAVGKVIYEMAASKLVPVTLELGGKSPCVVEADASIKVAARRIAMTKYSNAGQMCVAPDYVLVHESVKDKLVEELGTSIRQFFSDDAATSYNYGKIINEKAFNRLTGLLQKSTILYGGKSDATKLYIEPTLLECTSAADPAMKEEIFGPLLPILTYNTREEAKTIIDQHPNPLAFYLFTEKSRSEEAWLKDIPFGGGCINNASWHLTNNRLPFGGRGNSGLGAYHGRFSFDVFTHKKAVMKTPTWFDPNIKYPPFNGKLSLFKKVIR